MTVAIIRFPGSNCFRDSLHVMQNVVGAKTVEVWHQDVALPADTQSIFIPGGFSYGDYLRCGAMAAHQPIMAAVKDFAEKGGKVLGVCNGFQVLCEVGLLPGALMPNHHGLFACDVVGLEAVGTSDGFMRGYETQEQIQLPVAHHDGNYFASEEIIQALEADKRVAFRYIAKDADGHGTLNGSRNGIAGIIGGPNRNVLGMMPHPERRSESRLGGQDGLPLLKTLAENL
ncbi:MAG: phosphoribosylformylglycinamidine synthase I [Myxococcales bacterium]|nr:phosphoribosylformylglycinamidine synthase I [Myxococcales bacterium]